MGMMKRTWENAMEDRIAAANDGDGMSATRARRGTVWHEGRGEWIAECSRCASFIIRTSTREPWEHKSLFGWASVGKDCADQRNN